VLYSATQYVERANHTQEVVILSEAKDPCIFSPYPTNYQEEKIVCRN
jgi:hypothetical protein